MTILERFRKGTFYVVVASVLTTGTVGGHIDKHTTLTSGAGDGYMKVIISSTGNVWYFESPAGASHISTGKAYVAFEGYTLCTSTGTAWDLGSSESGWGAPTINQPNGANTVPLTIKRTTTDGKLELKQIFTRDSADQELNIEMTLKNVSSNTLSSVRIARWVDADVGGIRKNTFLSAGKSILGSGGGNGFMLIGLTTAPMSAFVGVEVFDVWNPFKTTGEGRGCGTFWSLTGDFDYVARYTMGSTGAMSPGTSRTIKLIYKGIR